MWRRSAASWAERTIPSRKPINLPAWGRRNVSTEAATWRRPSVSWRRFLRPLLAPLIAIVIAMIVGALLVVAIGQNPVDVYVTLFKGGLVGWPNLSVALQSTT